MIIHNPESFDTHRLEQWRYSMYVWGHYPVTGIGLGAPLPRMAAAPVERQWRLDFTRSHSTIVGILAETGVVGFVLFLFAYLRIILRAWRLCEPGVVSVYSVCLWILVGWLVVIATTSLFLGSGDFREPVIWLIIGAVAIAPLKDTENVVENP